MHLGWRISALAFAGLGLPGSASAQERILDFASRIAIQRDGSLDVTETIRVNAENNQINHGIYRDFPTRYAIPDGGRMRVGFTLLDASLDGGPVESRREAIGNGVRIKLGDPDTYVTPGEHSYAIHYRATRELGFFPKYDELYWNVTGNGWVFPIERATATISLPSPAGFIQHAAYTGAQGSTEDNAEVVAQTPEAITFATTQPLDAYQGLTIAAAFPKGVVAAPSQSARLGWWLADLLPMVVAALGVAATAAFLFFAWARVGRDPRAGTVVPLFAPPNGLSPAAMRYILKEKLDDRAFAAALVEAGVKGHIRLVEEKGFLFLGGEKYIEGLLTADAAPLGAPEQSAISALVSPGGRIDLDNKNHAAFSAAKDDLQNAFQDAYDGRYFKRNYGWAAAALGTWALAAYLTATAIVVADRDGLSIIAAVPFLAIVVAGLLLLLARSASKTVGCVLKLIATLLAMTAIGTAFGIVPEALNSGRWHPMVLVLVGLPLAASSFFWINAPTKQGRAVLDHIAGFKHYLSVTEKDRLDRMQAPADTLQLFERFLPFAIALGIENRWADRFESQLAAAAAAGRQSFAWYSGTHSPWTDSGGFVNSLGSSLSSSISSASTAPGSSSGSGGGGSSGGGGGGGGGGGW